MDELSGERAEARGNEGAGGLKVVSVVVEDGGAGDGSGCITGEVSGETLGAGKEEDNG